MAEKEQKKSNYGAEQITVLEGLEAVRRRPGMYIGGTDEKALHHLFAEVIDNAMDEALAGHATFVVGELKVEMDLPSFADFHTLCKLLEARSRRSGPG